jgi:hypothetical protein
MHMTPASQLALYLSIFFSSPLSFCLSSTRMHPVSRPHSLFFSYESQFFRPPFAAVDMYIPLTKHTASTIYFNQFLIDRSRELELARGEHMHVELELELEVDDMRRTRERATIAMLVVVKCVMWLSAVCGRRCSTVQCQLLARDWWNCSSGLLLVFCAIVGSSTR